MSRVANLPWEPHFNRKGAEPRGGAASVQDIVELILASEVRILTPSETTHDGRTRYRITVEVEPDVAQSWEETRRGLRH